ncbi:hypothetical protein [Rhodopila sp.]|jgi:hypothetical protein|uniref:hypothetical protein n=1 Tax=Rhodopila sp. TaxID=2480087 RepID=UPI002D0A281D|nr:hypothetical protein [Rhodopila sp.]HVZ08005.1 hypothetical protein [Rhodopila sp.]
MSFRFAYEEPAPVTAGAMPHACGLDRPSYRLANRLSWADRRGVSLPARDTSVATANPQAKPQGLLARLQRLLAAVSWPPAADIWVDVPVLDLQGMGYPLLLDLYDRDRDEYDRDRCA